MRIVSIHQPAYNPWLGYFDRIKKSDVFVFLDNVQFEKNSFINRNLIKTANGSVWLTVPVSLKGHTQSTIKDILIDNSRDWVRKHLHSVRASYSRVGSSVKSQRLERLYNTGFECLSELCYFQLLWWLNEFGIKTQVVRASDLQVSGKKSELILNICDYLGADFYLSGPHGKDYLDESSFKRKKIKVVYHNFKHPEYPQLWGDFIPNMGVIDWWMNVY